MAEEDNSEKEKQRIRSRRWYLENRELAIRRTAEWKKANPQRTNEHTRDWRRKNPDKASAIRRRSIAKNKSRIKHQVQQRRLRNPEKHRLWRWRTAGWPEPTRPMPTNCECCGGPPTKRGLNLDHCHKTGVFRGWLCTKCNCGIGSLGDNESGLEAAIKYLRRVKCESGENS